MSKPRVYVLDFVRALAILLVCMGHALEQTFHFADTDLWTAQGPVKAMIVVTLFTIARYSVPFFLFLTGYLFLPREYDEARTKHFFLHNFARLLLVTELWIIVYNVFNAVFWNIPFSAVKLLKQMAFLEGVPAMDHFWYLPMILGIYLFLPLFAAGLKHISAKFLLVPAAIVLAAFTIRPALGFEDASVLEPGFSGGVFGLYLLLGYLVQQRVFAKVPVSVVSLVALLGFLGIELTQYLSFRNGDQTIVWYTWGTLIVSTACCFELFVRHAAPAAEATGFRKFVTFLARYSFAVYLIHFPLVQIAVRVMYWNTDSAFLTFCAATAFAIVLSFLLAWLLDRIPKVGRYFLYMR
ncbi:MAG: acyltransferase [Clostridia bacterium]|nr:acyltransferase [Clostridia bacterium]